MNVDRRDQPARRVLPADQGLDAGDAIRRRARRSAGSAASNSPRSSAPRRSASVCSRSSIRARISLSNSSTRPRPAAFARYIAVSASRIASSAESPPRARPRRRCSAPGSERSGSGQRPQQALGQRQRLLGPGQRLGDDGELVAADAGDRVAGPQRCASRSAAATSSASPVEWPYESFTSLNRSRSMYSTPTSVPVASRPVERQLRAGRAAARGSGCPVSASCIAW